MATAGEKQHEPLDEHVRGGETLPAGPPGKRDYLTAPVVAALSLMTVFLPARIAGRDYSEGKKIGWKSGFPAIWSILKFRFVDQGQP